MSAQDDKTRINPAGVKMDDTKSMAVKMMQLALVFVLGAAGGASVPTFNPGMVRPDPYRGVDARVAEAKAVAREEKSKIEMLERISGEAERTRAFIEHKLEVHELRGHSVRDESRYIEKLP